MLPSPSAAWLLDGSPAPAAAGGGTWLALSGACNWTRATEVPSGRALGLLRGCSASAAHSPGLGGVGSGSLSVCVRVRSRMRGEPLVSKGLARGASAAGFGIEIGEERGLGISLLDRIGVSVHEELGRTSLNDGAWHHVCAILQRAPHPHPKLSVYADGQLSESLPLGTSRLSQLGSVASEAPVVLGGSDVSTAYAGDSASAPPCTALAEVAVWPRALLPEHVAALWRDGLARWAAHGALAASRPRGVKRRRWRPRANGFLGGVHSGEAARASDHWPGASIADVHARARHLERHYTSMLMVALLAASLAAVAWRRSKRCARAGASAGVSAAALGSARAGATCRGW